MAAGSDTIRADVSDNIGTEALRRLFGMYYQLGLKVACILSQKQMARNLQINWQHSARQLKYHYRHEKHSLKRTRLHALWLLRRGQSLLAVADLLEVAYRTLQYWVAWYRQGGLHEVLRRLPGHHAQGKFPKLKPIQQRALVAKVQLGTFRTIWDALQWIHDRWGIAFSYFGLYSCLRRLKCSPKVPRPRSERANLNQQTQWKKGAC